MVPLNVLAIVIAAVAAMVVGWLWYGPLFGKVWRRLAGDPTPRAALAYPIALIASAATAFVLAYVTSLAFAYFGSDLLVRALFSAGFLWLGFAAVRALIVTLFETRSIRLFLLDTGHDLAVALVMAVIIGLMGL